MEDILMGEKYRLYHGDCLEVMKQFPDNYFDACITDPPYGIGENRKRVMSRGNLAKPKDYGEFSWDEQPVTKEQIDHCRMVSKNQVIFGGNYFELPPSPCWIVWDKKNTGDFADCELAWTSFSTAVRKIEWMWNGMLRKGNEERFHPTQKPMGVMRWIIENYTQPNDLIIDPFMGSGTTGVACAQLGRRFVGIELDPDYFAIAKKRIENAYAQPLLFEKLPPKGDTAVQSNLL